MGLATFFEINLPYGIKCNEDGEWTAFNRENLELGNGNYSALANSNGAANIYIAYHGLTEKVLWELAEGKETRIIRGNGNKIDKVLLYDDLTKPTLGKKDWDRYSAKLNLLSSLSTEAYRKQMQGDRYKKHK
jgi:hypothetical protein